MHKSHWCFRARQGCRGLHASYGKGGRSSGGGRPAGPQPRIGRCYAIQWRDDFRVGTLAENKGGCNYEKKGI